MSKAKTDSKQDRTKHVVYTNKDSDVEEMVNRAMSDGRTFSKFGNKALRAWLVDAGYADDRWKGPKFSRAKCPASVTE